MTKANSASPFSIPPHSSWGAFAAYLKVSFPNFDFKVVARASEHIWGIKDFVSSSTPSFSCSSGRQAWQEESGESSDMKSHKIFRPEFLLGPPPS